MKTITELLKKDIEKIKIICFDCDGVTVEKGTEIEEFKKHLTKKEKKGE